MDSPDWKITEWCVWKRGQFRNSEPVCHWNMWLQNFHIFLNLYRILRLIKGKWDGWNNASLVEFPNVLVCILRELWSFNSLNYNVSSIILWLIDDSLFFKSFFSLWYVSIYFSESNATILILIAKYNWIIATMIIFILYQKTTCAHNYFHTKINFITEK